MPEGPVPFRAIADSTYDWETWIDAAGRVRWVNPAVERFTGRTPAECLDDPDFPLCVVSDEDRATMGALLARAAAGGSGNDVEFRVVHREGHVRWAAISFQPLVDGDTVRGYRTSVRDIDERKRFEERLRDAERAASRAAEDRTELLATLSHELRSPLHCIAGYADLLRARASDAETRRQAGIVVDQSESVLRHVEDLLRYVAGDATSTQLSLEPFDLTRLLTDVIEVTTPRARPGVALRYRGPDGPLRVLGDRERVRQVTTNLIDNALRYTTAGEVIVTLERTSVGHVRLIVSDTGPGMSDALRARARQPFVQGPGARAGGVGLGLAIVDRLVRAMEGHFALQSAVGRGTRAIVELPLPRARVRTTQAATARVTSDVPLRVLVVDDSEPARELVVSMVRALGHEADEAASGSLALAAARARAYDLVLIDFHMPDRDGVSTATALVDAHAGRRPFVVVLTANVLVAERAAELPAAVDRVVTKPLRLGRLRELVAEATSTGVRPRGSARPKELPARRTRDFDDGPLEELLALPSRGGPAARLERLAASITAAFTAVEQADAGPARAEAAHSLKGLLLSVGATSAARRAARVEARGRAGSGDAAALRALSASAEGVLAHLTRVGVSVGVTVASPPPPSARRAQRRARAASANGPSGSSSR